MGTIAEKLTYLNTTKIKLRDSLNKFGSSILSTDTFRSYDTKLNEIYDKLPKVTGSGAGLTITPVQNGQVDDFKMIGTDLYQNQLPSEYTAVEYLQSDNECFIDTGINADYKLSLKMKVACLDSVLEYMGAIKNIDNTNYIRHHLAFAPTAGNIIGIYYGQTNDQLILKEFDNNFHEFNLDIYNKKVSIDNNSTISISYNNFDVGINYYLFARNGSNIAISKGSYKIAYCKMYYEDKLVRDFAPCYRNSDNVAGLYDFVTNTFFTNQGTGTFTVGNTITLPNPDYPQDIKVVEGRQVITDKGKNLLKLRERSGTNNGITISYDEATQVYTFNGTCTQDNTTFPLSNNEINFTNGITKSITYWVNGSCSGYCSIRHYDSSYSSSCTYLILNISSTNNKIEKTSNASFVCPVQMTSIRFNNNSVANNLQIKIMVTDDENTDFEPYYNPVSYNIDLNSENLSNGINQNYWLNTSTTNCGISSSNSGLAIDVRNLDVVEISTSETQQRYRVACVNSLPQSGATVNCYRGINKDNTSSSITINTAGYNYLVINATDLTKINVYYKYKLAKMPNTDYKNRIYKNNGNWYFEENVKNIVLDGSENWAKNSYSFYWSGDMFSNKPVSICSHFIDNGSRWTSSDENLRGKYTTTNAIQFKCMPLEDMTLDEFKTWLSTNNVDVWCQLDNPITTQITNTTLINQLEAISVHTGTNIITISNDNNIIPEIEITRLKELEKLS